MSVCVAQMVGSEFKLQYQCPPKYIKHVFDEVEVL
jgi:hypothetical protein